MAESTLARQLDAVKGAEMGRFPPQSLEAEESVLGGIFLAHPEGALDKVRFLREKDFYREKHRRIFAAMLAVDDRREPVDLITIGDELKRRDELEAVDGETYLTYLVGRVPTAENIVHYARIIQERAQKREIIKIGTALQEDAYEPDTDPVQLRETAERRLSELGKKGRLGLSSARETVRSTFREIERRQEQARAGGGLPGFPTPFPTFNDYTGGLQGGHVYILAGDTGLGKTGLALQIALTGAKQGLPVLVFSLEMTREENMTRLFSMESQLSGDLLFTGAPLADWQLEKLEKAAAKVEDLPFFFEDDPDLSIYDMRATTRRVKRLCKDAECGLVVVDYLQLLELPGRETMNEKLAKLSRNLKKMSQEKPPWAVLALSQLNRDGRKPGVKPDLYHLRDSGAIEQEASVVAFTWAENKLSDEGQLRLAKNRVTGVLGTVELVRQGSTYQSFEKSLPPEQGSMSSEGEKKGTGKQ